VRTLGLNPYRAETLVKQARRWPIVELESALEGLLELDAMVKGAPGSGSTERQRRLTFAMWIEEHVAGR
jgi:DNA polymerase III delta subunit